MHFGRLSTLGGMKQVIIILSKCLFTQCENGASTYSDLVGARGTMTKPPHEVMPGQVRTQMNNCENHEGLSVEVGEMCEMYSRVSTVQVRQSELKRSEVVGWAAT